MKGLHIWLLILLSSILLIGTAQEQGDKSTLTSQREKILKELAESKRILSSVRKDKSNSLLILNALENKLNARKALISNYQNSLVEIESSIQITNREIESLEQNLEKLKKDYAQMIRYAYLHRTSLNIISFIFSADSYKDAFKRIGYLRKYRQVRNKQVDAIVHNQDKLKSKISHFDKQKSNKTTMIEAEMLQKNTLESEKTEKAQVYENFKLQEKEIKSKIAKQQADARKLQNQIQYLIKKEMQANAARIARQKAEAERQAKIQEAERKKKIEAARIAREKAEAERKRIEAERLEQERLARIAKEKEEEKIRKEQERLQRLQDEEKRRKQEERMAAAKKAAEEAYKKRQAELAEIKRNEQAAEAKVAEAKAIETQNIEIVTPTTTNPSTFGQAQGRLNRPVSGKVVGHFGTQSHPVFSNIKIENNGVDIYASSGAPVHAVYAGSVSSILPTPGGNGSTILINHGEYFTVYTNLASIKVGTGTQVNKGQIIGTVGSNSDGEPVINFQIWKSSGGSSYKLNPENWIRF